MNISGITKTRLSSAFVPTANSLVTIGDGLKQRGYDSFISCLKPETEELLEKTISDHQPRFERNWKELEAVFRNRDYTSSFFKTDECRYTILEALKQNRIGDVQASTLLHFHEVVLSHPEAKYVPFPECFHYLQSSYYLNHPRIASGELFNRISQLPISEHGIFLTQQKYKRISLMTAVLLNSPASVPFYSPQMGKVRIEDYQNTSVMDRNIDPIIQDDLKIVPSIGMYQAFLDTAFPPTHQIHITPKLGMSTLASIKENGLKQERDLFTPCRNIVRNPKKVDRFEYQELFDVARHDAYHAIRAAFVPPLFQRAFIEASNALEEQQATLFNPESDPVGYKTAKLIIIMLRDMDHSLYETAYIEDKIPDNHILREQIDQIVIQAMFSNETRMLTDDEMFKVLSILFKGAGISQ